MPSKKLKIAVTGGIGSGKTSVCEVFENAGFPVLKADDVAKEILSADKDVRKEIIERFGSAAFKGNIPDHKYLAEVVFDSDENTEIINSIIHPRTIDLLGKRMNSALKKSDMVFVESALIFEAKREKYFDYILLITSDVKLQISRVIQRSKLSEAEILRRIDKQIADEVKRNKAHFVIENNSSLTDLKNKAKFFLSVFKNL